MSRYFSPVIRQLVAVRANFRCEYCRKPDVAANFPFHVEHIIGRQHNGTDYPDNLAYACSYCNWHKGPNISTMLNGEPPIIPLFNPRKEHWYEHFWAESGVIYAKTDIGEGTLRLLQFNTVERILERKELIAAGVYP